LIVDSTGKLDETCAIDFNVKYLVETLEIGWEWLE